MTMVCGDCLHHRDLRTGLEIASSLGLGAQSLDGGHYVGCLVVISLSQLRRPREVLRHVVQHRGELGERLDAGIPGLPVHRLPQRCAREVLVLLQPIIRRPRPGQETWRR